jgi:hypothetical protein
MASGLMEASPSGERSRGVRLALILLSAALVGAVALLWSRLQHQEQELARARGEFTNATGAREAEARIVYVRGPDAALSRAAEQAAPSERVSDPAAEAPVVPVEEEPRTAEERTALRKARFDHIQGIFESQSAHDYEPTRARRLETAFAGVVERLRREAPELDLGKLECRGRMCAADVSFDDPARGSLVYKSALDAVILLGEGQPRPHVIVQDGERPGQQTGRVFFEWMPPADG